MRTQPLVTLATALLFAWRATPGSAQAPAALNCSIEGDTRTAAVQALNRLKNRTAVPAATDIAPNVTMTALTASGDDRRRFDSRGAARIAGYVADVKVGGVESVNCHAKAVSDRDTHIELTLSANDPVEGKHVIIEVTPRWRAIMRERGEDWSTASLRRHLLGRWVEVTGWMLFDQEHLANAANTQRGKAKVWRATAWEVHPVTSLRVVPAPALTPRQ